MLRAASQSPVQAQSASQACRAFTRLRGLPKRRHLASLADIHHFSKPGESLHGFLLKRTRAVPELQLTAFDLEHERTGADYLHVARDDPNNVFSIGFKTNPPDNTGVPHILEHTTLCGSQKYCDQNR